MKEFKGTKGKWSVSDRVQQNEHGANYVGIDCIENGSGVSGLAIVFDGITEHGWQEMHANAQLISKAPELLEAMQEFCDRVDKGEVRSTKTYNKFKELIKQATEV